MSTTPQSMSHEKFVNELTKPLYVWRMARGLIAGASASWVAQMKGSPSWRSADTRMVNAQKQIDELVLQRAAAIMEERNNGIAS